MGNLSNGFSSMIKKIVNGKVSYHAKIGLRAILALMASFTITLTSSSQSLAEFKLCNKTNNLVGIAIGYKGKENWITEGWWNIAAGSCEQILSGRLISRYYYIYAIDYKENGEWKGASYMCTQKTAFTINGIQDCVERGYQKTGFLEIDTGEEINWTVQLTERGQEKDNPSP